MPLCAHLGQQSKQSVDRLTTLATCHKVKEDLLNISNTTSSKKLNETVTVRFEINLKQSTYEARKKQITSVTYKQFLQHQDKYLLLVSNYVHVSPFTDYIHYCSTKAIKELFLTKSFTENKGLNKINT